LLLSILANFDGIAYIVNFSFLCAGYICIPRNTSELSSGRKLSYLEAVGSSVMV
jgi:hypothetical protein